MLPCVGSPSTWATAVSEARQLKLELISMLGAPIAPATCAPQRSGSAGSIKLPPGVVGVGYGARETRGAGAGGEMALRVYVRTKLPRARLARSELIRSASTVRRQT
jgi:hypothetical protein